MLKEYFEKLLNTEKPRELIKKGNKETREVEFEVEELTKYRRCKKGNKKLKSKKAAETDETHPKLIKYEENKLLNTIFWRFADRASQYIYLSN